MKVYITYGKNGYGGSQVDRVFKTIESARMYIVTENTFYDYKTMDEQNKEIDKHIFEYKVIDFSEI